MQVKVTVTVELFQPWLFGDGEADAEMEGGTNGATVNVTVATAGEPWAPAAVTVRWPVYIPAVRLPTDANTCSVCGAVPPVGVADNQVASAESVNVNVPVPVFATLKLAGDGFAPPWMAAKLKVDGVTERIGEPVPKTPYAEI